MKIQAQIGSTVLRASMLDNQTSRDFLNLLPLTLTLNDFNAREKISDLPALLTIADSPAGFAPDAGDIAYYAPWGNLAIFYRPFGHSKGLVKLGTIDGGINALTAADGDLVTTIERAG
jgi:hypothetical protein